MLSGASVGSNPLGPSLIVANKGDETVGIVDPHSGQQVAAVPEGGTTAHEVIASPDGRRPHLCARLRQLRRRQARYGPATNMVVIDRAQRTIVGNLDSRTRGVRPHCRSSGRKTDLLYVSTELDKTISIIDPESR